MFSAVMHPDICERAYFVYSISNFKNEVVFLGVAREGETVLPPPNPQLHAMILAAKVAWRPMRVAVGGSTDEAVTLAGAGLILSGLLLHHSKTGNLLNSQSDDVLGAVAAYKRAVAEMAW